LKQFKTKNMSFKDIFFKKKSQDEEPRKGPDTPGAILREYEQSQRTPQPWSQSVPKSDKDYDAILNAALEEKKEPGLGFLQFMKAVERTAGQIPNEIQRYIATYATYQDAGVTTDKLIESAVFYQGVLDAQDHEHAEYIQEEKGRVDKLNGDVQALQAEIDQMNEKIKENANLIQQKNQEMIQIEQQAQVEENAFQFALQNKQAIIAQYIQKIQTYLNGYPTSKNGQN
jgi:hypothetical protein